MEQEKTFDERSEEVKDAAGEGQGQGGGDDDQSDRAEK